MAKSVDKYKYERMIKLFFGLLENQSMSREEMLKNIYEFEKPSKEAMDGDEALRKKYGNISRMLQRDVKDLNFIFENVNAKRQIQRFKGSYYLVDTSDSKFNILNMPQKIILMELLADSKLVSFEEFKVINEVILSSSKQNKLLYKGIKNHLNKSYQEGLNPYSFKNEAKNEYVQSIYEKIKLLYPAAYLDNRGQKSKGLNTKITVLKIRYRNRKYKEESFTVIVNTINFNHHHMYVNVTLLDKDLNPKKENRERTFRIDRIIEVKDSGKTFSNYNQLNQVNTINGFSGDEQIVFECQDAAILPAIDQYIDMYSENNHDKTRNSSNKNRVEFSYANINPKDSFETKLQNAIEKKDGKAIFTIKGSTLGVKLWILGQGPNVKAISPPKLVDDIKKSLENTLKRYE